MAATWRNDSVTGLPQGFSVYQPALGAQLQFFPAVGTAELDSLINEYVPGPAPVNEKRASVSLDFLEYTHLTGQTFKFYPVFSLPTSAESPATASPFQDSGYASSFNASPALSTWDWSNVPTAASHQRQRQSPKPSASGQHAADVSNLPGMKIMTKDGRDVTNSASRGSKTKEQRDHAHLMRIIKACDSCRRKKIRCDPSHKKRTVSQPVSKVSKKSKAISHQSPKQVAPAVTPEELTIPMDPLVGTSESIPTSDELFAAPSMESWEDFIQFPPADLDASYDFFHDPQGYLSPLSSSIQSDSTKGTFPTPQSDVAMLCQSLQGEATVPLVQYPYDLVDPSDDYVDFKLFSPGSSFSEDEQMVSIEAERNRMNQSPVTQPYTDHTRHSSSASVSASSDGRRHLEMTANPIITASSIYDESPNAEGPISNSHVASDVLAWCQEGTQWYGRDVITNDHSTNGTSTYGNHNATTDNPVGPRHSASSPTSAAYGLQSTVQNQAHESMGLVPRESDTNCRFIGLSAVAKSQLATAVNIEIPLVGQSSCSKTPAVQPPRPRYTIVDQSNGACMKSPISNNLWMKLSIVSLVIFGLTIVGAGQNAWTTRTVLTLWLMATMAQLRTLASSQIFDSSVRRTMRLSMHQAKRSHQRALLDAAAPLPLGINPW